MKKDVINGYEWQIFEESELGDARAAEYEGNSRVLVNTKCVECHQPVQAHPDDVRDARHTDAYHESLYR